MPSQARIMSKEELQKMHTGSLMSRRKKLLQCEESFESSDRLGWEEEPDPRKTLIIEFKNTAAWKKAYRELKEVLATREHFGK